MKTKKFSRVLMACLLSALMLFGTCASSFAAIVDLPAGTEINYVSLGASNVNGYGLNGYLPEGVTQANKHTSNVYGYLRCPDYSYVDLVRDELEGRGFDVHVDQLAISSMRVEELRVLLDDTYEGDAYTDWRFTGGENWFNQAAGSGLDDLRAEYRSKIAAADLITVDIGVNNFGVYLSEQLLSGNFDDDLNLVDPELAAVYAEAKAYAYDLITKYANSYAAPVSALEFAVDAVAYALAGFCVNYDIVMEKIYELNPDATVVAVSVQNLMEGLEATFPGVEGTLPFGELFGALVDAANLYVAVGSQYSDKYLFADVSENGRVEFFLEDLLAYDGDPEHLNSDMRDCFDIYDDDLIVSTRVNELAAQSIIDVDPATVSALFGGITGDALKVAIIEDAENGFPTIAAIEPLAPGTLATCDYIFNTVRPAVLEVAYDVVAEIMQLGAQNNVLDLATLLTGTIGIDAVQEELLDEIEAEVLDAATAVIGNPSYTYTIDPDFLNNIAPAEELLGLIKTVATLGVRTSIGNSFFGHPNKAGHIELRDAIIDALENETKGIDVLKAKLGITAEDEECVKGIIDEATEQIEGVIAEVKKVVGQAKDFVDNATKEDYIDLAKELAKILKAELGITDEDIETAKNIAKEVKDDVLALIERAENLTDEEKAEIIDGIADTIKEEIGITDEEIDAIVAELYALVEQIESLDPEAVKAEVNAYIESLKGQILAILAGAGQVEYDKAAGEYYVAIGDSTVEGIGLIEGEKTYHTLVAEELGVDKAIVVETGADRNTALYATEVVDLILANADVIANADLITYQADASALILSVLGETDWDRYISEEAQALLKDVLAAATEVLTAEWADLANAEIDAVVAKVQAELGAELTAAVSQINAAVDEAQAEISAAIAEAKALVVAGEAEAAAAVEEVRALIAELEAEIISYIPVELAAVVPEIEAAFDVVDGYVDDAIELLADGEEIAITALEDLDAAVAGLGAEFDVVFPGAIDALCEAVDGVIAECIDYVKEAIALVEETKDGIVAEIAANEQVFAIADKVAFAAVSYVVENAKAVEAIKTINPEAALVVVGMYNPVKGLEIAIDGTTINAGELFEYVVSATNIYNTALAIANDGVAFVNVAETETFGVAGAIDLGAIASLIPNMHANANGHEYIKTQIINALVQPAPEATEAPTATPEPTPAPTRRPSGGSGGFVSSKLTVTFDSNGGSKVPSASVKKGETVAEPVAPTKAGFVFDGWFTDKALTAKYDFSTPVTKSFTLYAKWVDAMSLFTDLDPNAWYYEYVKAVVQKGLMNGLSTTIFGPNESLTRGMFVTILYRLEGTPEVKAENKFTDVAADQYYANAVVWANANGIVKGISDTEFAPNEKITREQMAAVIARYVAYKKVAVPELDAAEYTDAAEIADYAKAAVKDAKAFGILIGYPDGSFAPAVTATRAEAAAIFVRIMGVLAK